MTTCFESVERAAHRWQMSIGRVDVRKGEQNEDRGKEEERARYKAAARPVQEPVDVSRKLLRFRPRQHHAVVERMEEALLIDPPTTLDEFTVHDGDLAGWSTERDET